MIIPSFSKEVLSHEHSTFSHRNLVLYFPHFLLLYLIPLLVLISRSYFVASSCLSLLPYFRTLLENFTPLPFVCFTSVLLHLNISSPSYSSFSSFISFSSSSIFSLLFYFSAVFHVHTRTVLHSETIKDGDVKISTQLHRPSA